VRRITVDAGKADPRRWPYTLPVVKTLMREGLDLDPGVTVFIGANGSGKSTLVEAIASAWGRRITAFREDWLQRAVANPAEEDSDLDRALRLRYTRGGPNAGLFFRAERLHTQMEYFSEPGRWQSRIDGPLLEQSHGEGFLQVLQAMTTEPGLYILDEPEAALSFESSLALLSILIEMRAAGSQVLLATHSPILASCPGARILQCGSDGLRPVAYDESELVNNWKLFLAAPERYLRHLIPPDD
jgi:predicted ATPase